MPSGTALPLLAVLSPLDSILAPLGSCGARFNTPCFLFTFLPLVLAVFWLLPPGRWRWGWAALASLAFYGSWDIRFVPLLVAVSLMDFGLALLMRQPGVPRKPVLVASVVVNLSVLAFFKYAGFVAENFCTVAHFFGADGSGPNFDILLPVGISFYTFKTLSYIVDVYRGDIEPTRDVVKYLAFVSLFPDLVAGPIVRYRVLSDQMDASPRWPQRSFLVAGLAFFVIGLFKKVVVADSIGVLVNPIWAEDAGASTFSAWTAALGFGLQLYFDFSGYSDMAIGLGALLALKFPVNFRAPFQARNPRAFWARWHMTLSTFVRDYLYIPLGGNTGTKAHKIRNIVICMLAIGIWHGAAWTFIVWGLYVALRIIVYEAVQPWWDSRPVVVQQLMQVGTMTIGFAFFRSPHVAEAWHVVAAMLWPHGGLPSLRLAVVALVFLAVLAFTLFVPRSTADLDLRATPLRAAFVGVLAAVSLLLIGVLSDPFIYYKF